MRVLLSVVLVFAQAVPMARAAAGSLEVEAHGGQVSVRAYQVPLNRILDRLAQQTGMKVSYEATPPTQPVTATLDRLPPREAVVRLMEGLGVAYVFRTDVSGQRVETLIVSGAATATQTASSNPQEAMEYSAEVVDDAAEYEEPSEIAQPIPGGMPEMPQPVPGMPAPDLALPNMGPGFSPQGTVGTPGNPNYPNNAPSFPGPISYPN